MNCPTELLIEQIGDRWILHILHRLSSGTHRTQALLEGLAGISSRTLAAKLKDLEAEGWIERRVYPVVPPRVEYQLTEKGRWLRPMFAAMKSVSEQVTSTASKERKAVGVSVPCPSCEVVVAAEEMVPSEPKQAARAARLTEAGADPPRRPPSLEDVVLL
jgi:DNA-binding HxlR family transcriptional regulator